MKVMIGKNVYISVCWKDEEVVENMVKWNGKKMKTELLCASASDASGRSVRFVMDTGCGLDLMSQRKVKELGLETFLDNEGMTFKAANGLTGSNEITVMEHGSLEQCKLHVLNQTPAVTSRVLRWTSMH